MGENINFIENYPYSIFLTTFAAKIVKKGKSLIN
jgi:hypothetical protein